MIMVTTKSKGNLRHISMYTVEFGWKMDLGLALVEQGFTLVGFQSIALQSFWALHASLHFSKEDTFLVPPVRCMTLSFS